MSNTHRRRRRDSTVELSRVGGVNAPVGSLDQVSNFLCCWAIEVGDKWRYNHIIDEKVISIDQNSRSETAMFSFQIVDRIRQQSSWDSCELCSHRWRRRDSIRQLSRVGVGGVSTIGLKKRCYRTGLRMRKMRYIGLRPRKPYPVKGSEIYFIQFW